MAEIEWNFEDRQVEFTLNVHATYHPAVGSAYVCLPWVDDTVVSIGPLSALEPDPPSDDEDDPAGGTQSQPGGSQRWPDAVRASASKSIGTFPVSLELARNLQSGRLPIKVYPEGDQVGNQANSRASLFTGGLLLSGDAEEAAATFTGMDRARRVQPKEVVAVNTETIAMPGLYNLRVTVSTDIPVLSQAMIQRLLPISLTVEVVRGLQNEEAYKEQFEEVYVELYPDTNRDTAVLAQECPRYKSGSHPHHTVIRFNEPVVWLLGLAPLHAVREWMMHQGLVVEIHDQDNRFAPNNEEDGAEEEEDADAGATGEAGEGSPAQRKKRSLVRHPHGAAHFRLTPLLASRSLCVPLRADVFPRRSNKKLRRAEIITEPLTAQNILSEEGQRRLHDRNYEGKREDTTNYHKTGTVCTLRAVMAAPLPEAASRQAQQEELERQRWAVGEEEVEEGCGIWKAAPPPAAPEGNEAASQSPAPWAAQPFRAKVKPANEEEEVIIGPWRRRQEDAEEDLRRLREVLAAPLAAAAAAATAAASAEPGAGEAEAPEEDVAGARALAEELASQPNTGLHMRYEKYGRAIMIFRDEDTRGIQRALEQVREQNSKVLGINAQSAEMNNYMFSEAQRADPHLDVLTGFVVLDGKVRLMIVEGLRSVPWGGIEEFLRVAVVRNERPNSATFKLLYHPEIGFSERLYLDFGPVLKTIKVRPELAPIERLAAKSELYSFAGNLDEVTLAGMQAPKLIMELKRMSRQRSIRQGPCFPASETLNSLETLYGGYLTDEEIAGLPYLTNEQIAARNQKPLPNSRASQRPASRAGAVTVAAGDGANSLREQLEGALTDCTAMPSDETTVASKWKAKVKDGLDQRNPVFEAHINMRKSASTPSFIQTNMDIVKDRSEQNASLNDMFGKKRYRETPFMEDQEVYMYSQQKLNSSELQKDWMRSSMDKQQADRSWSYNPAYASSTFEFSGVQPPGDAVPFPTRPNDTYSRLPGDTRAVWRGQPARDKAEYRKPERDVPQSRADELHEAFVENELSQLPIGMERRQPIKRTVRFEPDKVPHHRMITERPFDASKIANVGKDFGPKPYFESVNYHAHNIPGMHRFAKTEVENVAEHAREREQDREHCQAEWQRESLLKIPTRTPAASGHLGKRLGMTKSYSEAATRVGPTCLDRREPILKDKREQLKSFRSDEYGKTRPPPSIRQLEEFHERGRPDKDFQCRMRENDCSPPFDVNTGRYVPRDPELGHKRAVLSGTLPKAPWRHGANGETSVIPHGTLPGSTQVLQRVEYASRHDFDRTKKPPRSKVAEEQLWKNASRTQLTSTDRQHATYKRPKDYGVVLEVS